MSETAIITPQSHPDHPVVGHYFGGYSYETKKTEIYFCDSYDPRIGFWLTNVKNAADRHNVSERAIGRTYHEARDHGDCWYIHQWGTKVEK